MDIQLIYQSKITCSYNEIDIIVQDSKSNNIELGLTGLLLVYLDNFYQVLEGKRKVVNNLYHKIANDKRHDELMLLSLAEINHRQFGLWSMEVIDISSLSNEPTLQLLKKFDVDQITAEQALWLCKHSAKNALL